MTTRDERARRKWRGGTVEELGGIVNGNDIALKGPYFPSAGLNDRMSSQDWDRDPRMTPGRFMFLLDFPLGI